MTKFPNTHAATKEQIRQKRIAQAAERANAEADARRNSPPDVDPDQTSRTETGGRNGPDPARYGDWEKDGIISDF